MNTSRKNWSLLQQMSYDTNKRLRKHQILTEKQKELEKQQQQHILEERRMHRRQKLEFLRKRFNNLKRAHSECIMFGVESNIIDSDYHKYVHPERKIADRQKDDGSFFDGITYHPIVKETSLGKSNSNRVNADSPTCRVPANLCSRIPIFKYVSPPCWTGLLTLRRSQSADEIFCNKPSRSNPTQGSRCDECGDYTISTTTATSEKDSVTKDESYSTRLNGELQNCSLQSNSPTDHTCLTLNWLHTGTPPLSDSHAPVPLDSDARSEADFIVRVSKQAHVADYYADPTVPIVCVAPIYSIAGGDTGAHLHVPSVPVEHFDNTAILESLNTINPIPSPEEPNVSPHLQFVVPKSHMLDKMFPNTQTPLCHNSQVSKVLPQLKDTEFSKINTIYFSPGKTTSIAIVPRSMSNDQRTCVDLTGWTHSEGPQNASTVSSGLKIRNDYLLQERYSPTQSDEVIVNSNASATLQTPFVYPNIPLRSILKPRSSNVRDGPERLPGYYDNFSELTALRTRDSMELAPMRLRLGAPPEHATSTGCREPSPETTDSLETDRSGSPRSMRKSVRFMDQIDEQRARSANSTSSPIPGDMASPCECKPDTPGVMTSSAAVRTTGPIISVIYPKYGQENPVYPSTSYDAPIRNTILPSLNQSGSCFPIASPPATSSSQPPEPLQNVDSQPTEEPKPPLHDLHVEFGDRLKPGASLSKPPIQPHNKCNTPLRFHRHTLKPGYADLMVGRPRRPPEPDVRLGNNNTKSSYGSATSNLSPSSTGSDKPRSSAHESLCSKPPVTNADRVSPTMWKIPSLRSMSGPPTFKRPSRDRNPPCPKLVNTTRLNELTRAVSEPRNVASPTMVTKQVVQIPSAFNTVRLTYSPTKSEADNRVTMTRLTELNYETSMTTQNPLLTLPVTEPISALPDYEGMNAELSEKLKLKQRKAAFQHAIYLTGKPSFNQDAYRHTTLDATNFRTNNIGASGAQMTSNTRSAPTTVPGNRGNNNRLPYVNQSPVIANEARSLPPSGRLLNRRPCMDAFRSDVVPIKANSCPLNSTISNAYTLERHGLVQPQYRCKDLPYNQNYISSPNVAQSPVTNARKPHTVSQSVKPSCITLTRNPIYLEQYDNNGPQHQQFSSQPNFSATEPSMERGRSSSRKTFHGPYPAAAAAAAAPSDTGNNVSESLAEFIESERACDQTEKALFETSKTISCGRHPVYANRTSMNVQSMPDTTSTMSIEEARLLNSLERLNNRLCDIMSNR